MQNQSEAALPNIAADDDDLGVAQPNGLAALAVGASRHVALLAAWVAMCGSLFFSDVLGWPPCLLCWYQRICMYPLAAILAVGIVRRDRGVHAYVLPLALLGACISTYHYLLLKTRWLPAPPCAEGGVPCTVDYLYIPSLPFVNIPFLALVAFIIIAVSMLISTADAGAAADDDEAPRRPWGWQRPAAVAIIVLVVGGTLLLAQLYRAANA
ncbi:MAG: disulfide bond formation protein B [Chloroflexales bacterium]|nr:disulfide bond formation protein B [Chloroflexales bacterium]